MGTKQGGILRQFPFIAFLALLMWSPLPFGSNRPWAAAIVETWVFALSLWWLCGYALGRYELTYAFRRAAPILGLLGLWLVHIAIQILPMPIGWIEWAAPEAARMHMLIPGPGRATVSVDPDATLAFLLKSAAYVSVFALAMLLVDTGKRLRQLAGVLVFSGLLQALYGSVMTLSGLEYGFWYEKEVYRGFATGTFVNRNHLAGYLEMALAAGVGLLIGSLGGSDAENWRQRLRNMLLLLFSSKMRLRVYLGIMVVALVLSRSRMGNVAFFSSLIIAGVIGLVLSRHATRSTVILLTSLVVIDVFIVGTWFGLEKVAQRLQTTSADTETRDEVNAYGLDLVRDYAWTGSGGGSFYAVFPRYRIGEIDKFYAHAHNDYLELACDTGIIGLALLGAVVILSLRAAVIAQHRRRDALLRGMGLAGVMGITALLIHSAVDFNLQIPANAMTFMIMLAFCWLSRYVDSFPATRSR